MKCWICYCNKNLYKCCDCKNDYGIAHRTCIIKWIYNKKNKCIFCKKKYNINILVKIILGLYIFLNFLKKQYTINTELLDEMDDCDYIWFFYR